MKCAQKTTTAVMFFSSVSNIMAKRQQQLQKEISSRLPFKEKVSFLALLFDNKLFNFLNMPLVQRMTKTKNNNNERKYARN